MESNNQVVKRQSTASCRRFLGIEFAPIMIPLQRRLQTFTVACFFVLLFMALFIVIPFSIHLLLFTEYWFVPALYLAWIMYDRKTPYHGGRNWKWLRNWKIWNYYRDYFPISLVKTAHLPPEKNYFFCAYPHGVISAAVLLNFQSNANRFDELYPKIDVRMAVLNANFRIPFTKDLWLAVGGIAASENSLMHCLTGKPGNSCVLLPGGEKEALLSFPGNCTVVLKNRKGFVRVALRSGACLVPVFSFGENEIFNQYTGPRLLWIQDQLRKITGIPPCFIKGRGFFQYSFGLIPQRRPITTVVGAPIHVPKVENPTQELIDEYHHKYVESLVSIFETYKDKYHVLGKEAKLHIV